jgi:hypothetical protein
MRIQDRFVDITKGYMLEGRGLNPGDARDLSLLHIVQTGSGAQPPFYEMGTGNHFPGCKAAGSWS